VLFDDFAVRALRRANEAQPRLLAGRARHWQNGAMFERLRAPIASAVLLATASAFAFGVTIPIVARLGGGLRPLTSASLLYAGAALVSLVLGPFRKRSGRPLTRDALPRLLLIGLVGAALAPLLLVLGLARAGATGASLVLNFEALFTVLLAWLVYREPIGARVGWALFAMTFGGVLVLVDGGERMKGGQALGLLAVLGATACWALDNTLTRRLADRDSLAVVAAKGALGAVVTGSLALGFQEPRPSALPALGLLLCGATGYGLSLRLYLSAQRRMGAARTASVFATGPFIGAALGWLLGDRGTGLGTALGALAFGIGVYLHATERHSHRHLHTAMDHEHPHRHDDGHHDHIHDPPVLGEHTHPHHHEKVEHDHEHAPDIDHEHAH
jgi:drug/metabolite transporter (DMT)-like permease